MGELLTLSQAKEHLRLIDGSHDTYVQELVAAARDYCERTTGRTLRTMTARSLQRCAWWSGRLVPPFPPLLAVTAINYYDEDDADQVLDATNYRVVIPDNGVGFVEWDAEADLPALASRADAVRVSFTTGYADVDDVPPLALAAMRLKLTELFGSGSESELKAAASAADNLLNRIDWTGYV